MCVEAWINPFVCTIVEVKVDLLGVALVLPSLRSLNLAKTNKFLYFNTVATERMQPHIRTSIYTVIRCTRLLLPLASLSDQTKSLDDTSVRIVVLAFHVVQ